jgi:hypothetical protein
MGGVTAQSALAGARGPAQASASLAREARRYQSLQRATSWVKPMFALAPLLGEGSLYGTTLGILVDALAQQGSSQSARPGRKSAGHELSPVSRAHSSVSSSETRTTHSSSFRTMPTSGGRTNGNFSASGAAKHPGVIGSSGVSAGKGASFLVETSVTVVPASAVGAATESTSVANIVGSVSTTTMAMLREQLAQRAATQLTSMRTSGDQLVVARALMGEWGSSMEGVGASEELLLQASAVQQDGAIASAPTGDSLPLSATYPSPAAPQSESEARTNASSSVPALAPAGTAGSVAPLPGPTFAPSATLTEEIFFRSGSTLEAGNFLGASRTGAQIAEPGASLKVVGGPDFPTVEDLDLEATEAFSAKMKRVLDEEARRYGIDV